MKNSSKYLVLCRTPLQAFIAKAVINELKIKDYDLIYFTYHDSAKDRHYFDILSRAACRSMYVNVSRKRKEAIQHWIIYMFRFWGKGYKGYRATVLASFDNYLFRMLVSRQRNAKIITIDDGTANITSSSSYFMPKPSRLTWLYDFLSGAGSREDFKRKIDEHYSIYRNCLNIVDKKLVRFIDPWSAVAPDVSHDGCVTFFIGQPFEEVVASGVLSDDDLSLLEKYLSLQKVDYYLQHPRETKPLAIGGRLISESGSIAEELVFELSANKKPVIYGWFTTTLFNVDSRYAVKRYLSVGSHVSESERVCMCEKFGCEIVKIR